MSSLKNAVANAKEVDPKKFSLPFQESLFGGYQNQTQRILSTGNYRDLTKKDRDETQFFKTALEKLEFQEKKVDELSDQVRSHLTVLESKVFRLRRRFSFDVISWQSEATLSGPAGSFGLLTTNLGFCPGFGYTYENRYWAYSADLHGLYGSGGVSAPEGITYQHPLFERSSPVVLGGDYITTETGVGYRLREADLPATESASPERG
jgi:hypothetical protein